MSGEDGRVDLADQPFTCACGCGQQSDEPGWTADAFARHLTNLSQAAGATAAAYGAGS